MPKVDVWLVLGETSQGFHGQYDDPESIALRLPKVCLDPAAVIAWVPFKMIAPDAATAWTSPGLKPLENHAEKRWLAAPAQFPLARGRGSDGMERHETPELMPNYLVRIECLNSGESARTVYASSRIRTGGLLFALLGRARTPGAEALDTTVSHVLSGAGISFSHRRQTDESHQCASAFADTEVELKFTLGGRVKPWTLASRFAAAVQRGELPNFIPDVGNEMQRWTYQQYSFDIKDGSTSVGHAAFMTTEPGDLIAKFKFFERDSLRRREVFDKSVDLQPNEFEGYLRDRYPTYNFERLPDSTRSRFDTNVQSVLSGDYFGIECDEVLAGGQSLRQVELEYHRTQMLPSTDPATVESELFRLRDIVKTLLAEWGIPFNIGYLSKLTFLRGIR